MSDKRTTPTVRPTAADRQQHAVDLEKWALANRARLVEMLAANGELIEMAQKMKAVSA